MGTSSSSSSSSSSTGGKEFVRSGSTMSAAERRAAEDNEVPGLVPRDRPPPEEAEWWREKAKGGSAFFNVGEATWQASREQYRTQGRRKSRPAPPPAVYYDSIHSGLMSPRRTYELPGRMTLTDIVSVLNDVWEMDG